jgi:hypothetical protein
MIAKNTIGGMAKKKTASDKGSSDQPAKVVLYLEVPPALKEVMDALAQEHNRKLVGECIQALQEYAARHNRWPPRPALPQE